MKQVWFDVDCERILSMVKDMGVDCEDMYCTECSYYINEITQHKRNGCEVVYIDERRIKTINLKIREDGIMRPATVEDLEKAFLAEKVPPNFAYALAKINPLSHRVIGEEIVS